MEEEEEEVIDQEAELLQSLLEERAAARGVKDFVTADLIHEQIRSMGYNILPGSAIGSPGVAHKTCPDRAPGPEFSTLPATLRTEVMHAYDVELYPFEALISELVDLQAQPLHKLHHLEEVKEWQHTMQLNDARAYAVRRNMIDGRLKQLGGFRGNSALNECYLRFLRDVVMPLVGDDAGIFYQVDPCFRCHLPGTGFNLVKKHCDADYFHSPNEINFWVPCTSCFDTNTLFVESVPKKGDFHPWVLVPGQMMQFWGNQCVHYTLPNETDHTRVSFDFRVIPRSHYLERYPMSHRSDDLPRFAPGAYFATMDSSS
ncbi:unnamed protein product [Polarella glacialis]|uniref:Uncharacterized protein n=1 Tax=Polarella glacialis TaxID=89957 RepID=A0A813J876_POLGL|nr:unnamed protein product [Polarella glacialis]